MSFSIVTSGLQMIPASSQSVPGAVSNFTVARQGASDNGVSNGTQNKTTVTLNFDPASGSVDHYQPQRSTDYGAFVDYGSTISAAGPYSFTDTAATNIYNADNIGETAGGSVNPGGQTTIYRYRMLACADAAGTVRGPAHTQMTQWLYKGAAPAWSASTTYRVGDVVSSGGTQYFCVTAHANHVPPNGSFWFALVGGYYGSSLGDVGTVSFGGTFTGSDTTGNPVGGGTDILCTNTAGAGNVCGLQLPTGSPGVWNYGMELGWANYLAFDFMPVVNSQQMDFACFSRAPTGDRSPHFNLANFTNSGLYGAAPQAGVWTTYKLPLSLFYFSTPGGGIATGTASCTGGIMAVTSIPNGMDATSFIGTPGVGTTPGATSGVWLSDNGPSQNGTGNYGVTMGPTLGTSPPDFTSRSITARRTNFYKTALKNTQGQNWWVNNVRFLEA